MKFPAKMAALLAVVIAVTVGCSSTVTGKPQPGLTPVDLAALKTGAYTPEPSEYDPDITDPAGVHLFEAQRMLGYLVHPADIDSDLSVVGDVRFFKIPETPFIYHILPEKYRSALVDNNICLLYTSPSPRDS